ncbi:hypothetical protein E4S40_06085 [Algoriphagus kandeliae]|uniref:OmpA-like domain-containing protein n=1 Tax=Algoriphagus kandeliae TaxID=2562278 RepID=A0A4Y9QTH6_9BACT|nr:OmpA family protein [Algoriphagus kandeliae]TFV95789.1 hypothetical protein E4S40_06085 [Algoriphagus kandeliae]
MKRLFSIFAFLLLVSPIYSQQYGYKWRFGFSAGTTNYFGDIRPLGVKNFDQFTKLFKRYDNYSQNLSYQASIEYALGNSIGLMFTAGSYQFGSSDRFVKNDGTLYTEGENFNRALNFQTNLIDAGLSFVIKPDNNWLLSGKSIFAPYLTLGMGVQSFDVYGDLLDANGNRYNYKNQNVIPDGTFETNLRDIETEIPGGYKRATLYANLGLGFRIRVAKGIEIFAQSDFKRAATDYLDDVSGVYRLEYDNDFQEYAALPGTNVPTFDNPYRGNRNGRGDWYIYHGIGVKFSLGATKESFQPPVISQRYTFVPDELLKKQMEKADSIRAYGVSQTPVSNNYFTVIQLPSWEQKGFQRDSSALDSAALAQLDLIRDSIESQREGIQLELLGAQREISQIDETIALAQRDTTVSEAVTESRLTSLESERSASMERLTNLNSIDSQLAFKLDSIEAVKANEQIQYLDSAAMFRQLLIYPGQVSKILYSASGNTELYLDSLTINDSTQKAARTRTAASDDTMTREEFEEKMDEFRSEMLQAQATRDSAMMMAFASRIPEQQSYEPQETEPQEVLINTEAVDEKTAKKLEKNRKKQEKLDKKNNELLKDALLVGGTAATTAAIANSGDRRREEEQARRDSLLMAQIQADSILIDSLQRMVAISPETVPDTVFIENTVPSTSHALLNQSKVEVFFGINQTEIADSEKEKLMKVKEILDTNPELGLELIGFADNTGTVSYNLQISGKRVESVKNYFISLGIDPARISSDVGGLIIRGASKGSVDSDRKVEVRFREWQIP